MSERGHVGWSPDFKGTGGPVTPDYSRLTAAPLKAPQPARIVIQPDAPAVLGARLAQRLKRSGLLVPAKHPNADRLYMDALTEALADEIHQAAVDGTLGGGP